MLKSNFLKVKGWLIVFFIYILGDIILQFTRVTLGKFDLMIYLLCLITVFAQFYLFENLRRIIARKLSIILIFIFCLWITLIFIGSFFIFREFGDYITASKFEFNVSNTDYLQSYVKTYLLNFNVVVLLVIAAILTNIWIPKKKNDLKYNFTKKQLYKILITIFLIISSLFVLFNIGERKKLTPDISFFVSLYNGSKYQAELMRRTDRIKVQPYIPKDSINILLILNESWGKKALTSENGNYAMPFLKSILEDTNQVVFFNYAFSQSGSTEISVPSMFSGVEGWESKHKLHSFPLIWDWARSGGLKTIFISAQAYYWCNLDEFMTSPGPDAFLPVNHLNIPLLHDGADEMLVSKIFCDSLRSFALSGRNFLAIYNSNACHKPFQQESKLLKDKPQKIFKSSYRNSCLLLDYSLEDFFKVLIETNALENTVIIITGDHAETDSLVHQPLYRLYSYYDETLNIPLIIRLPKSYIQKYPFAIENLKKNKQKTVANLDILPTIVNLLRADTEEQNKIILSNLLGYNLLDEIPDDRICIGLTTNEIRRWEYEGFGIISKNWRYVFSNIEEPGIFNVFDDPMQTDNLYNKTSQIIKDFFNNIINSNYILRNIYLRWK